MKYNFDVAYIIASLPALLEGMRMTIIVSAISITLAIAIGVAGASVRIFNTPILSLIARAYVEFIRNTPLLVQIFFIFFGLPALGLKLSVFWSGTVALTIWGGAYNIENFRGGFLSVGKGMREAAEALGIDRLRYLWLIALPLGLRVAIPSVLNTSISVLKNSAYLAGNRTRRAHLRRHGQAFARFPYARDVRRHRLHLSRTGAQPVVGRSACRVGVAAPVSHGVRPHGTAPR